MFRSMCGDGGLYRAYRVLRFLYSDGGLYWAYKVLRFMNTDRGKYRAYGMLRFMYGDRGYTGQQVTFVIFQISTSNFLKVWHGLPC